MKSRGNCIISTLLKRLLSKNLKQFDGGDGDCFFKAVSHQLYNSPNYHQNVRKAGTNYLCTHPEQFIESVTGKSWSEYINDMSPQVSWCVALMVQAVADALNCVIDITESAVNFNETTTIVNPTDSKKTADIHIGHLGEFHYVSTISIMEHKKELHCTEKKQRVICNMNTLIQSFYNSTECGPEYICTCCDQLWYRSSVQLYNSSKYKLCGQNMIKSVDNNEWICNSCHSNLINLQLH